MNKTQVQLAAFNRICPKSLSIASIPYAQKHSHIAWQKVGLYQEERSKGDHAFSLGFCLLDQPFSFLKTRQNTTLRGNSIFRVKLARLARAKPAAGSSALQLVGAERFSGTLANCHEVGVAFIGNIRRQTPLGHSKRRIMYAQLRIFSIHVNFSSVQSAHVRASKTTWAPRNEKKNSSKRC